MAYPAKTIANFFIKKAKEEGDQNLNLMKLLKLIYMAHGWCLAFSDKPLIVEPIEAWKYGPVIPEVYHALKHHALRPIHDPMKDFFFEKNGKVTKEIYEPNFDEKTEKLLENVWNTYRPNTGIQLSNWSHNTDGPWYKSWYLEEGYKYPSVGMPDEEIKQYFKKQLGDNTNGMRSDSNTQC